ncbi:chaperonin 10-like protein [Microdochium trichocladiopsis]|uniref:Chaperonin 10-like protein n=1 Tax=Microdochium trichocladiopsis TaxID=1682393 RepID=A0A9P9BK19_9PEZI|nr:chaperonin 10-like protein [Microdochium trichocladiopsis]KAH7020726.1 chaperonin 10-like protein [Microdochium trichocladiopsis]
MLEFTVFKGSASGAIVQGSTTRDLKDTEVLVRITHSGVCYSDQNYRTQDMVLGHEGAGTVLQVGAAVTRFSPGQRCAFGYQHSSCNTCAQCLSGNDAFCPLKECYAYANRDQGSFGTAAIWDQNWLFHVPEDLASEHAAPLMCAGSTVWSALQLYPARPTDRIGVIGLGGLGHVTVLFAKAMGCAVVVFSGSEGKREDAVKMGADEFYVVTPQTTSLGIGKPLDRLLATGNKQPEWSLFLPLMAPRASIYPLTIAFDNLTVPFMQFVLAGLRLQGATISSRQGLLEMLDFAARNKITPWITEFPMTLEGVSNAMDTLKSGGVRYRAVLRA